MLTVQCGEAGRANFVDAADAVYTAILRRERVSRRRPLYIISDKRLGLLVIDGETLAHRFFLVVVALDQIFAGDVVLAGNLRRIELDVIRAARRRVYAPAAPPLDDRLVGAIDFEPIFD